jgi:hypothetical protein
MGIRTFCMFTVDSNILVALSLLMCIPYTIEGLRTGYYHLPDWVVVMMHATVSSVALTFIVSLCVLAPVKGFYLIFSGSRFFLHGVCPVLSIVTFCFFINSHIVKRKEAALALVPVLLYAAVYMIMVVIIGEEKGGWNVFYGFATRVPVWVSLPVILAVSCGLALFLRWAHNACCMRRRRRDAEIYKKEFGGEDLREVIAGMARRRKKEINVKNFVIPVNMIGYMIQNTKADMTVGEGVRIYFDEWMKE